MRNHRRVKASSLREGPITQVHRYRHQYQHHQKAFEMISDVGPEPLQPGPACSLFTFFVGGLGDASVVAS